MFTLKAKFLGLIIFILGAFFLTYLIQNKHILEKREPVVNTSRDSVIKEIQELGNLETASYSIEKIVEAGENKSAFQNLLFGDRILLIANGKIIAGVNMSEITQNDVTINGTELSINLPPPVILLSTLDNSKTKVYDRTKGLLNPGDKDLESLARDQALKSITTAACQGGILAEAKENAIERITQLFKFAGFTKVTINIPDGAC
jgi:hypothetical protein